MIERTSTKKSEIHKLLVAAREKNVFPGCVIGIVQNNTIQIIPFGTYTYDSSSPAITVDSVYDVASVTKAIPTSSLALYLLDRGEVMLDLPVVSYISELAMEGREVITLRHLLTHTLDFDLTLSQQKQKTPAEIMNAIFHAKMRYVPGEKHVYTNATSILLGLLLERVSKKSLAVLAADLFFTPLGMRQTTFHPEKLDRKYIVPTEIDEWRGLVHGSVHDEGSYALQRPVGAAGLFSTAGDLLLFLQMLVHGGVWQGRRYFSSTILSLMATNQLHDSDSCVGLGWELSQRRYIGTYASEKTISKTGFTGCVVIADLEKKAGLVMLSNYTYPKRKSEYHTLNALRAAIADIVFSSA